MAHAYYWHKLTAEEQRNDDRQGNHEGSEHGRDNEQRHLALTVDDLVWFCRHYVLNKERIQVDGTYQNLDPKTMPAFDLYTPGDLYK
jgi:hypothetical protein